MALRRGRGAHVRVGMSSQWEAGMVGPARRPMRRRDVAITGAKRGAPRAGRLGQRVRWWKFQKGARGGLRW